MLGKGGRVHNFLELFQIFLFPLQLSCKDLFKASGELCLLLRPASPFAENFPRSIHPSFFGSLMSVPSTGCDSPRIFSSSLYFLAPSLRVMRALAVFLSKTEESRDSRFFSAALSMVDSIQNVGKEFHLRVTHGIARLQILAIAGLITVASRTTRDRFSTLSS